MNVPVIAVALLIVSGSAFQESAAAVISTATSVQVRSDSAGSAAANGSPINGQSACSGTATASCGASFTDGTTASSFRGSASAIAQFGRLGVESYFEADSLRAFNLNFSEGITQWTDRYIVDASVDRLEFVYRITGTTESTINLPLQATAQSTLLMFIDGVGFIGTQSFHSDADFVFNLPRNFVSLTDAFATPISTQFRTHTGFSGSPSPSNDEFVSGIAIADFLHTLDLVAINLYGPNGQITDIPTIAGESGTLYRVGGYVDPDAASVPIPATLWLLVLGLAAVVGFVRA